MKSLILASALFGSAVLFSSCGGGGGGNDDGGTETVRPKTMDGIILNMDNSQATFEFIRNTGTNAAVKNGDVETGTFIYTNQRAGISLTSYDNLNGDKTNFQYPLSVTAATYTYRAINDSSGILTLTASGVFDFFITIQPGSNFVFNDSWIQLFFAHSPLSTVANSRIAEIAITFSDKGSFVTSETVTLRLPESPLVSTFDTVRIPTTISLATLVPVPKNYNPTITERAPSKIAPASLSNRLMRATNGIPDPTKDFTIQFVSDALVQDTSAGSEEIGRGILSVYDPSLTPPGLTAVGIALDYTWRRIPGTDRGELVLSNIPDNPSFAFDTSLNGTLSLNFTGAETGTYSGSTDSDTPNPADVSGTFILPANN
jgi:hypothetical protein